MMRRLPVWTILCLLPLTLFAETPNPYPPQEGDKSLVVRWDFETGLQGWTIHQDAVMTHGEGAINLVTSAPDPILNSPRFKCTSELSGHCFIASSFASFDGSTILLEQRSKPQFLGNPENGNS